MEQAGRRWSRAVPHGQLPVEGAPGKVEPARRRPCRGRCPPPERGGSAPRGRR
ncbi:hypothetical protein QJS66_01855 [Kocuria rhizophila]|nr:hypothetical protein QJS66_01855 [Kocuria rhizophila]